MHAWRVSGVHDELWIAAKHDVPSGPTVQRLTPGVAAWRVDEWFDAATARRALLAIGQFLGEPSANGSISPTADLKGRIRAALLDARLIAYGFPTDVHALPVQQVEQTAVKQIVQTRDEKTWIAIQLVDDQSPPNPMAYKRYRVTLPDHSESEGILDENGFARLNGIDPGKCKVTFPDLDAGDWKQA